MAHAPSWKNFRLAVPGPVVIASGSNTHHQLDSLGATFIVAKPISVERAVHTLSAARNMIMNERLRYHRQDLDLPVSITLDSGESAKGEIINLSQGGAKLRSSNLILSSSQPVSLDSLCRERQPT